MTLQAADFSNAAWSSALQSLYGAVVNEERYFDFLDQAQALIDARFMVLGMFDPHDPERHVHRFAAPRAIGLEGAMAFLGLAAQSHADGSDMMLDAGPRQVLLDIDAYEDRSKLDARPTMKHLRDVYGARHIGTVNAQANNAWVDYFMFAHDDEAFASPEEIRRRVAFFVPHIGVASEVRRAFSLLEKRYQAIFSALNYLRYGVALALDTGETLLMNAAFESVLEKRDGLHLSLSRRLRAVSEGEDAKFQRALADAIDAARGDRADYRETIAIARSGGDDVTPYIIDIAPFRDGLGGELNIDVHGALLFVVDPDQTAQLSHRGLSAAFKFTPAEETVCRQLLDGRKNIDIAEANNTALPTVKSHVSSIFSKARVTDRASLMRLAAKVTPPLADDPQSD